MRGAVKGELVGAREGWFQGKGARGRRREHNRSPKLTVGSGCSPPFGWFPPTAKSPEEIAQKCAAGRDAVQIGRLQEVVSKSRISSNPVPQHEFDYLGAYGHGASATPYRRTDGRQDFATRALEKGESAR